MDVPEGWRKVNDRLFCPKHALLLLVDGKALQ
jgi:hypothetical protein